MSGTIPSYVEPARLVDRQITLEGVVKADSMQRLAALLAAPADDVQVKLQFARDEQGIGTMHGHYQTNAPLICQRCLEQVVIPLDSECDVGFVETDEAAKQLPRLYEPVIVGEEPLDLVIPPKRAGGKGRNRAGGSGQALNPVGDPLFDALRELRRDLAKQNQVPPYVIFHDSVLRDMAGLRPQTRALLGELPGIGAKKLEAYGDAFLEVIRQYER